MSFGSTGSLRREQEILDSENVKYKERSIRVGDIDFAASQRLNARSHTRLNDDLVQEYALAMENGSVFPMHTVVRGDSLPPDFPKVKGWLVVSGLHRANAAQIKYGPEYTYKAFELLSPTAEELWYVATATNTKEGLRLTKAEQINSVIQAIEHGIAISDAINRYGSGITVEEVEREREDRKVNLRLLNFGIDPKKIERRGDRDLILSLPDARVMRDVVTLLGEGITQNDLRLLVQAIKRSHFETKTFAGTNELIAAARESLQKRKPRRRTHGRSSADSYVTRFAGAAGLLTHVNVSALLSELSGDESEAIRTTFGERIVQARHALDDIEREYTARFGKPAAIK